MASGDVRHKLEAKLDRQTFQAVWDMMHQYGVLHGLLAGVTALIRGAYESEGLAKALLDALLCAVIGVFAFQFAGTFETFTTNITMQLILAMVIGVVGANLIITTVRESFVAAIKQLNPTNWFKKAK
ncbi:holin/anti-holin [Erwinia phage Faunus]|uniref:Putative holin n=1 Tax=Erwinia phage Faunus TaxID=2182346 RepID=A0A2U8UX07_9CAUD|nr:holin/anti-holin [Erwinia phage Faunus]AWN08657.1 putative holin [Erwinia phage Faunus]